MKKFFASLQGKNFAPVLVLLGLVFIYLGIGRGEVATVFEKASRICLECIGLG